MQLEHTGLAASHLVFFERHASQAVPRRLLTLAELMAVGDVLMTVADCAASPGKDSGSSHTEARPSE